MNYKIVPLNRFKKDVKQLAKKYRHIKKDLRDFETSLSSNPKAGLPIPQLNAKLFKIRVRNTDLKKGKSAGYRVIYFLAEEEQLLYLVTMYAKGEKEEIRPHEIFEIMKRENLKIE